tara:strand:- start:200 stop:379 length:180 start_codon:yes stop_codon:yes gene_type:complete
MYKLYRNSINQINIMKTNSDGSITTFTQEGDNLDYQEYLKWVAEGNKAEEVTLTTKDAE